MPSLPFVWGVELKQSDGSARANVTIKITNNRTGETQTDTTNSSGQAVFDLANFESGYDDGDTITTEKSVAHTDMEYFISANGNDSNPTWVQVENETRTRIYPSTARFKLNLTRYPGGRTDLKITLD